MTLVTKPVPPRDGRVRYSCLPITMAFARNELGKMGTFEVECRQRYQRFTSQMELQESESGRFRSLFERFGLETDNEKRAAILCRRGESEMFVGNLTNADMLFREARDLAPQSAYAFAMSASYELSRNRIGKALDFAADACRRATKRTGSLCHVIRARILSAQGDRRGQVRELAEALAFDPEDVMTRHQYGVALSRAGEPELAIAEFDQIIAKEESKSPPSITLVIALKTKMVNLRRLGREDECQRCLAGVDALFRKYSYLAAHADEFDEFRGD